ncbi:hypothetical protein Phi4:1_gp115 [Cellulophaga phage phi4:1]|jgi:hypothetical protein|uniref:DUF551 domain-containing protein n=5 Tax=Lightbulbvirus TaxID=1918522 RepID=A0A0S2MWL5_9CAUD|nr:hypothetical protein Phi4:1_gp115 [Cellulophaga phage phi4:1]YP_008241614.1 hypothetical protein Phi17:2_gp119 [Cellulophaga phage phi17:2]ALO80124.1 hypothetical protein Phi4113_115 [Cellulophaga phage phi4:1_13]ALO80321.1 hypothetical protein Phi4118_115 [Cellulophaga phage phi4:1_18]ALO80522.1 hypothetical protein Phi17218_119 [Cellulophaga phage phi17:2_18]AGO47652.1 hypothetical protein Phi17:2_gp119 [Cellulophaga phage phi17:2]AGO49528.1 hypothetical protein Phi4:1_gp115 [Cellulophag
MEYISVKERLPENNRFRHVICRDGANIGFYCDAGKNWFNRQNTFVYNVVSWQELPDEVEVNISM